jgi:hypothetical protein
MDYLWYAGQLGIALEATGALYLVWIARRSKDEAGALKIKGANITYADLGPLLSTLFVQLQSHYRQQLVAFGLLFVGLMLQFAAAFG